jgi:hypothetical protein
VNGAASPAMAAGSEKSAAHRLGLSHSTVKHHLANARTKVGAETTAQLVWVLAARLPEPKDIAHPDACARKTVAELTLERSDSDGGIPRKRCRSVRTRPCRIVTDRRGRHHT